MLYLQSHHRIRSNWCYALCGEKRHGWPSHAARGHRTCSGAGRGLLIAVGREHAQLLASPAEEAGSDVAVERPPAARQSAAWPAEPTWRRPRFAEQSVAVQELAAAAGEQGAEGAWAQADGG